MQLNISERLEAYNSAAKQWLSEWQNIVFLWIVFIAVAMRLVNYTTEVNMGLDGFRHLYEMWLSPQYERPLLFSVDLQGTNFRMPPWYYYMIFPFVRIADYHPAAFNTVELLLFFASLPLMYSVVTRIADKTVGVIATALYGLSYIMYTYSMGSWNPDGIPFFVLAILWCLFRSEEQIRKHKTPYAVWIWLAIAYSVAPTFHFSIMPLYLVILGYMVYRWRVFFKKPLLLLIAALVPVLSYIPTLTWDMKNEYENLRNMIAFFFSPLLERGESSRTFAKTVMWLAEKVYNYIQYSFIQYFIGERFGETVHTSVLVLLVLLIATGISVLGYKAYKRKDIRVESVLVIAMVLASVLGLLALHRSFTTRYLIPIIPLLYICIALGLSTFLKKNIGKILVCCFMAGFLLVNISLYSIARSGNNVPTEFGYTPQRAIVEYMDVADWVYENRDPSQQWVTVQPTNPNKDFKTFNDHDIYTFLLRWEYGNMYPKDQEPQFAVQYITEPNREEQLKRIENHYGTPCEFTSGNLCVVNLWETKKEE